MIKVADYNRRLELIDVEFRFLRFAASTISPNKLHSFFTNLARERSERFRTAFLATIDEDLELLAMDTVKKGVRTIRTKLAPRNRQPYLEAIQDGLNAAELLIRIALFEAFMKDIHAELFRAKPSLLAKIRPESQVRYEHIFTDNPSFDAILKQQIFREIEKVDRDGFMKRADYFKDHLQLPLGDPDTLKFLDEMMDARHEISHENPLRSIRPEDLQKAAQHLKTIPAQVCQKARVMYGKHHFT